jgi:hypothetical protein
MLATCYLVELVAEKRGARGMGDFRERHILPSIVPGEN